MVIFFARLMMASILVLFVGTIACYLEYSALYLWLTWIGWGGMIVAGLVIGSKMAEIIFKEVVHDILGRFSQYSVPSESTTRTILNSGPKELFRYFINMGIIVISMLIAVFGLAEGLSPPHVKEVEIQIAGLHPDLEGFSIVQISDLHIFPTIRPNLVQEVVDQVNDLSPDVIALTGDIVDGDYS